MSIGAPACHEPGSARCAFVAVLDDGGRAPVRRDTGRHGHKVAVETGIDRITGGRATWPAARPLGARPGPRGTA